jgi:hypothetical protein
VVRDHRRSASAPGISAAALKKQAIGSEIPTRPTDDARRRRRGPSSVHCVVQGVPPLGRARPRRAGPATWRPDHRPRLVRAADVLAVREPGGRHGDQRDQAAVVRLRELVETRCRAGRSSPPRT